MGCVPVSTTVSGIPELVQFGEDRVLVEPRDSTAISDILSSIYADASANKFSKRARRRVIEEYTIGRQGDSMEKVIQQSHSSFKDFP